MCNRANKKIYNANKKIYNADETTSIVTYIYGENESYLSSYKIHIQFNVNTIRFVILILYL